MRIVPNHCSGGEERLASCHHDSGVDPPVDAAAVERDTEGRDRTERVAGDALAVDQACVGTRRVGTQPDHLRDEEADVGGLVHDIAARSRQRGA